MMVANGMDSLVKHSKEPQIAPQVKPSKLLDPIFSIILAVVHLLWAQFHLYSRFLAYQYHRFVSLWEEHYRENLRELKNIPTNVAIGISHKELNYDKLAELIGWFRLVPTIRTITIYHPHSTGDPIELKKLLPQSSTNFEVSFLPFSSGRQSLINAARYFASPDNTEAVTQEGLSNYLKRDYPNPDPELLLMFGECHIYNGFPCWQIRLTETVFLPPLEWVTLSHLHHALKVYSKCEQRFGT